MSVNPDGEELRRLYGGIFRRDSHQLLAWAYEDSRHLLTPGAEETEVTGYIAEAIARRLNRSETPARFDRYGVHEDRPSPGEGRTGKRRRRLDIVIESNACRPRPRYIFEAKRLRRGSHLIAAYLGTKGLQRFLDGRYGAECPEAAMVGYVQSETPEQWVSELEDAVKSSLSLGLREGMKYQVVCRSMPHSMISTHDRTGNEPLVVFHILLDCASPPPTL